MDECWTDCLNVNGMLQIFCSVVALVIYCRLICAMSSTGLKGIFPSYRLANVTATC